MCPTAEPLAVSESLDAAKARRATDVNRWRDAAAWQPVTVDGARYDADAASQTRIAAMATAVANGKSPETIQWRDADNITRELSTDEFMAVAETVMAQVQVAYGTSFVLKDAISAATTVADVRAVKWPND